MPKNSVKSAYVQRILPQLIARKNEGKSQLDMSIEFDLAQSTISRALAKARERGELGA